jgi:TrkA domain protein
MADVRETKLPGLGVRYDFTTSSGQTVGVLVHRTGRRDLLVYSRDDDASCDLTLELEPEDSQTLAEMLGASRIAEQLAAVQQDVEGLAIDWIRIDPQSEWAGQTLADAAVHTATGVSVVALIGDDGSAIAAPGARDVFTATSIAVAVGTPEGLERLVQRLGRPASE